MPEMKSEAPEAIPSVASTEMQVLTDSPSAESTNSELMTPAAVGASDIESPLPVSSTLPPVQPVNSDAQQLSTIPNTETQLIGDAESENGYTKPVNHDTGSLQDMVTRGRFGDAAATDTTVTTVTVTMFCCVVPDIDPQV